MGDFCNDPQFVNFKNAIINEWGYTSGYFDFNRFNFEKGFCFSKATPTRSGLCLLAQSFNHYYESKDLCSDEQKRGSIVVVD
jgi:hypothetical protein